MIPALQTHNFDWLLGGLQIGERACKALVMSSPVGVFQDAVYVLLDNPKHLSGYDSVAQSSGIKLSLLTGGNPGKRMWQSEASKSINSCGPRYPGR